MPGFLFSASCILPTSSSFALAGRFALRRQLSKEEKIREGCIIANKASRVGDPCIFYQQCFHLEGCHVFLQFLEISAVVQITKGIRRPMKLMPIRIDDEYIA